MPRNPVVRHLIATGAAVLLPAILGCEHGPSPDDLARQALEAPDASDQEAAATRLSELGKDAQEQLQRVLAKSQSPGVRATCLQALADQWDYDSMPAFFKALDDDSPLVRGRAVVAVEKMLSTDLRRNFNYRYNDPSERRASAVEHLQQYWEKTRNTPLMQKWIKKQREEQS